MIAIANAARATLCTSVKALQKSAAPLRAALAHCPGSLLRASRPLV
jgi:hypothetical protein